MRLHEVMGEYEGEGRICEELGFDMSCIHHYQHTLQRKPPQLAPIAISENHLKNAAMRTVCCGVGKYDSAWGNSQGARVTYRDPRSGGARVGQRYSRRGKLLAIVDSAL